MTEQTTPPADDSLSYVESPAAPAPRKSQPLLLVLAALGLGVAGTLAWSEQANIVAAISGQSETGTCSMSKGGCCHLSESTAVVLAGQSEEGSCCSMKSRATAVAATEAEAPVSALVPANSTTAVEAVTTL
jgi:hypothetical protein